MIPLVYFHGDGVRTVDMWQFESDGWRFSVWTEGVEWCGSIGRPDGVKFHVYAYGRDDSLASIDPTNEFGIDMAWSAIAPPPGRCCLVAHCGACPAPASLEIATLNRIKRQIFEVHPEQITTGVTSR